MRHEDLFKDERAMIEQALGTLERGAVRIEAGDPPTEDLRRTVAFLETTEETAYEASQVSAGEPVLSVCIAEHEAARVLLRKLRMALEARERGNPGSAAAFARKARAYVLLRREHMKRDDRLFSQMPVAKAGF